MKKSAVGSFSFNLSLPCVREGTDQSCRTPEDVRRILADTADLAQEAFTVLTPRRALPATQGRNRDRNRDRGSLSGPRPVLTLPEPARPGRRNAGEDALVRWRFR